MDDILAGVPEALRCRVVLEEDRETAIRRVLTEAAPGDGVVVAGKGHETYVEVHGVRSRFDDREVAAAVAAELSGGSHGK